MFSKSLYLRILLSVILILLISGTGLIMIFSHKAIILGCIVILFSLGLIGALVTHLNSSNRRIRLFLDATEDKESMLFFPEKGDSKEERKLYVAFNRINQLINELKLNSQSLEHFYKAILLYIPAGVITWDESGEIRIANEEALRLLSTQSLRNIKQLNDLLPEINTISERSLGVPLIIHLQRGIISKQISISFNQVKIQEKRVQILTMKDISKELILQENKSRDKLTHVLTHEIMNSIAPIVSLSDTLLRYFQQKDISEKTIQKTIRGLETIKVQGESLMHFTESYRQLSFLQQPDIKSFPLISSLKKLQTLFQTDMNQSSIKLLIHSQMI